MKKKQPWMFKGALVLALGKKGTITSMQENNLDGVDYVYYIAVKLEGQKTSGTYHPNDISELIPSQPIIHSQMVPPDDDPRLDRTNTNQ